MRSVRAHRRRSFAGELGAARGARRDRVAVFGRLGLAPVQVGVVGPAAMRRRYVKCCAGGLFAQHGVAGAGGDGPGRVHRGGIPVGDVLTHIVAVEDGAGSSDSRRAAIRLRSASTAATCQRFPLRTGSAAGTSCSAWAILIVESLRQRMIRSPTAMCCPRAAVTVGGKAGGGRVLRIRHADETEPGRRLDWAYRGCCPAGGSAIRASHNAASWVCSHQNRQQGR